MRCKPTRLLLSISALVCLAFSGCDGMLGEGRKQPMTPTGMAPVGQGPLDSTPAHPAPQPTPPAPVAAAPAQPDPAAAPAQAAPPAAPAKANPIKVPATVVNAAEAKKNPNIRDADNKIEGFDPLSQAASAYVQLRAKAQVQGFQAQLKLIKEGEGRIPSWEEFQGMMKQHMIEFVDLYAWQMYGYDPSTGTLLILEDVQKKAQMNP